MKSEVKKVKRKVKDKLMVSGMKGMVGEEKVMVWDYLEKIYEVGEKKIGVVGGGCDGEEVGLEGVC